MPLSTWSAWSARLQEGGTFLPQTSVRVGRSVHSLGEREESFVSLLPPWAVPVFFLSASSDITSL